MTKCFVGNEYGDLCGLETVNVDWVDGILQEIDGTQRFWKADVVFLAMGFIGAEKSLLFEDLKIDLTDRQTIQINQNKQTTNPKVFAAGDCERGQSLIVWAIADGRSAAKNVDKFLAQ